jgi:hypothetical protein
MFEDGTLEWGTTWQGEHNFGANCLIDGAAFSRKPEGKDQATWEKGSQAAKSLFNHLVRSEFMSKDFVQMGFSPAWTEDWNNMVENDYTTAGGWRSAVRPMIEESDVVYSYQAHPLHDEAQSNVLPNQIHMAYDGKKSTEQALEDAAAEVNAQLEEASGDWKG